MNDTLALLTSAERGRGNNFFGRYAYPSWQAHQERHGLRLRLRGLTDRAFANILLGRESASLTTSVVPAVYREWVGGKAKFDRRLRS